MPKITAQAPANIAFIKYWGKQRQNLNIPFSDSISMNLSECFTRTQVEFDENLKNDSLTINNQPATEKETRRVSDFLDHIRKLAGMNFRARIKSENSFPKGTGIASSASAFAALALAGSRAAGLDLKPEELSALARLGSGSACRSIPDGFAWWRQGADHQTSYATQLAPPDYWDLRDLVVILHTQEKKVGSTQGHDFAASSPFFAKRLELLPQRIDRLRQAFFKKDISEFGPLLEEEALELHIIAMTSNPKIFYLEPKTWELMGEVKKWRQENLPIYFTLDAGPNLHLICESKDEKSALIKLGEIDGIKQVIANRPAAGAKLVCQISDE